MKKNIFHSIATLSMLIFAACGGQQETQELPQQEVVEEQPAERLNEASLEAEPFQVAYQSQNDGLQTNHDNWNRPPSASCLVKSGEFFEIGSCEEAQTDASECLGLDRANHLNVSKCDKDTDFLKGSLTGLFYFTNPLLPEGSCITNISDIDPSLYIKENCFKQDVSPWSYDGESRLTMNGLCLQPGNYGFIVLKDCSGSDYQKWEAIGNILKNTGSGECLGIVNVTNKTSQKDLQFKGIGSVSCGTALSGVGKDKYESVFYPQENHILERLLGDFGAIYSKVDDKLCPVQIGSTKTDGERNAEVNCEGYKERRGDISFEKQGDSLYMFAQIGMGGSKCGLQWGAKGRDKFNSRKDITNHEYNAKFDCNGGKDPIEVELVEGNQFKIKSEKGYLEFGGTQKLRTLKFDPDSQGDTFHLAYFGLKEKILEDARADVGRNTRWALSTMVDGKECLVEWGHLNQGQRNARLDCSGVGSDPAPKISSKFDIDTQRTILFKELQGKMYIFSLSMSCGLEWGSRGSNSLDSTGGVNFRSGHNAKFDCDGSADPIQVRVLDNQNAVQILSDKGGLRYSNREVHKHSNLQFVQFEQDNEDGHIFYLKKIAASKFESQNFKERLVTPKTKWKMFATVNGQKCSVEWSGEKDGDSRNARVDCKDGEKGDPITFHRTSKSSMSSLKELYVKTLDGKCGLEWNGVKGSNDIDDTKIGSDEYNAKFDCSGGTDPLKITVLDPEKGTVRIANKDTGSLEWDGTLVDGQRNLKFEPGAHSQGDVFTIEPYILPLQERILSGEWKMFTLVDGKKCAVEWSGETKNNAHNARVDCNNASDTVTFSQKGSSGKQFYIKTIGGTCGLEWHGSAGKNDIDRTHGVPSWANNAKFDCAKDGAGATIGDPMEINIIDGDSGKVKISSKAKGNLIVNTYDWNGNRNLYFSKSSNLASQGAVFFLEKQ